VILAGLINQLQTGLFIIYGYYYAFAKA